jgi:hypothetical protein
MEEEAYINYDHNYQSDPMPSMRIPITSHHLSNGLVCTAGAKATNKSQTISIQR